MTFNLRRRPIHGCSLNNHAFLVKRSMTWWTLSSLHIMQFHAWSEKSAWLCGYNENVSKLRTGVGPDWEGENCVGESSRITSLMRLTSLIWAAVQVRISGSVIYWGAMLYWGRREARARSECQMNLGDRSDRFNHSSAISQFGPRICFSREEPKGKCFWTVVEENRRKEYVVIAAKKYVVIADRY